MTPAIIEIGIAIVTVAVSVVFLVWFLATMRKDTAGPDSRMARMLTYAASLQPEFPAYGAAAAILDEMRRECQQCASGDLCERWLDGKADGDNSFCRNVRVLGLLPVHAKAVDSREAGFTHGTG